MKPFTDALRGYGEKIFERDEYRCVYCGLDGRQSFDNWLALSVDHLLPKGHPKREDDNYQVTACKFCNTADNRYFDLAEIRGLVFEDAMNRDALVAQRKPYVDKTRADYRDFWHARVRKDANSGGK